MSKRLGGTKGCKYKTSLWHLNGCIWRIRWRGRISTAEGEMSPLGGQQEQQDRAQARPEERYARAGAEDAEHRSISDTKKGEKLLLGT